MPCHEETTMMMMMMLLVVLPALTLNLLSDEIAWQAMNGVGGHMKD